MAARDLYLSYREQRTQDTKEMDEIVGSLVARAAGGSKGVAKANDQFVTRVIRNKIAAFLGAESVEEKLSSVMAMAALSGVLLISNNQLRQSTIRYIESRL